MGGATGVAAGIGIRPGAMARRASWSIDYAYQPFGSGLPASHRIALAWGFAEGWKNAPLPVSAARVRDAARDYVERERSKHAGVFAIRDEKTKKEWRLELSFMNDSVRRFGRIYAASAEFTSLREDGTTSILDVEFWVRPDPEGFLEVQRTRIRLVDGVARFRYKDEGEEVK
jgi:hypothetical protein